MMAGDIEGDIITPERYDKGDMETTLNSRGEIIRAIAIRRIWLNWLIERDILTTDDERLAMVYIDLRNAHNAAVGYKIASFWRESGAAGEGFRIDDFRTLLRALQTSQIRLLDIACYDLVMTWRINEVWAARFEYRQAFDALDRILHQIREARDATN